jgi:hypothetical protein
MGKLAEKLGEIVENVRETGANWRFSRGLKRHFPVPAT